ncbi:hypothetical protein BDY24DRAFT_395169, partial [Mrakia frigida]|uniref:uncharacterized protein n=1 Tax=Mrakia frigida TaxID=29902 RepID=UPI003FCC1C3E
LRPPREGEEQSGELVDGETRELRAARELKEFERRLREVVRLEAGGKQGNLFLRGEEIRTGVDSWLRAKGCDPSNCSITPSPNPYSSYLISPPASTSPRPTSHQQVVHLVPTAPSSLPPRRLPSELLALTVDEQDASTPFGWEAVFEPALVIGARGSSNSWGRTLLQQARSLPTPLPDQLTSFVDWDSSSLGYSGTKQRWSFAETPSTEGVAISRVGLSGVEEAGKVIEWARAWSTVNEFWLSVFDSSPSSSSTSQPTEDASSTLDLDDLDSFFLAPPSNLPVTLHLILPTPSTSASHLPSILLSLPHPSLPLASFEITISPSLAGPPTVSLSSSSGSPPIEEARLAALAQNIGGWGQGVVKWVVDKLSEEEVGARSGSVSAEAKRKRAESSEDGGAGE